MAKKLALWNSFKRLIQKSSFYKNEDSDVMWGKRLQHSQFGFA